MTVTITKPSFNLRDALVSLKRKIGIKGAELMAAETAEDVYSVIGTNRNLIINGDFRISQRGDYTTATNISENTYYLDRWRGHNNAGAVSATFQQITTTINGVTKKAIRVQATSSSGGAYIGTTQIIEQINFPVGQPVTVSAWVRTNNPYTRFRYNGIGGSKNSPNTVPANGGWHKITWTIPDTSAVANNVTFWVICYSDSGNVPINTNDYFEVADYQVEIGTVATPFEHRPYGTELALCQRYFEIVDVRSSLVMNINASEAGRQLINYETKRATPTIGFGFSSISNYQFYGNANTSMSAAPLTAKTSLIYHNGFNAWTPSTGGCVYVNSTNNGSFDITVSAEI